VWSSEGSDNLVSKGLQQYTELHVDIGSSHSHSWVCMVNIVNWANSLKHNLKFN